MWNQMRSALLLLVLLWLAPWQVSAQARMERDGVTLYWGLVPGAVLEDKHALADLHGGARGDGGSRGAIVRPRRDALCCGAHGPSGHRRVPPGEPRPAEAHDVGPFREGSRGQRR